MSCHDIGRGLNEVVRGIVILYEEGEISKEAAKKLIGTCRKSVNWCDGNWTEGIDYVRNCRCGRCFKIVPKNSYLLPLLEAGDYLEVMNDPTLATDRVCEECFDKTIIRYTGKDAEELKKHIVEHLSPEEYLSTGEHPDNNVGFGFAVKKSYYKGAEDDLLHC